MRKKELKKIYNAYAPNYSSLIEKVGWWSPRLVGSKLKPLLDPNSIVLDAACGDGYSSLEILDFAKVYAFDHAEKMVEYAKLKNFQDVRLHDADFAFPYKNDFFDAAIGLGFFEFIKNIQFTLNEFKRVVKKSGYILITVEDLDPCLLNQATKFEKVVDGVKKTRYSKKEMTRIFRKLKLKLEQDERIFGYESKSLKGKYYYRYYLLRKL
jgi:ubiquinone/menaquinone biosynthesis C-methylase UbiE